MAATASHHFLTHRIDQVNRPLDLKYSYAGAAGSAGAGTWVYVMDSGVRWTHQNFGGRGRSGVYWPYANVADDLDYNGHGTHVVSGDSWPSLWPRRVQWLRQKCNSARAVRHAAQAEADVGLFSSTE